MRSPIKDASSWRFAAILRGGAFALPIIALIAGMMLVVFNVPRTSADSKAELSVNNLSLGGKRIFPAGDEWNRDVSKEPVDPDSAALIASIGMKRSVHPDFGSLYNGVPWGIPYVVVSGKQKPVPVEFDYKDESDPGPYPIPPDAPIEGGPASTGDRHVLVVDRDNWKLYE